MQRDYRIPPGIVVFIMTIARLIWAKSAITISYVFLPRASVQIVEMTVSDKPKV